MRIVHLNTNRDWGGGEKQILELIRGSQARGLHSTLVAHPKGALFDRCPENSLCSRIAFRPRRTPLKVMQLCGILKRAKADVLHLHDGRSLTIGVPAATWIRTPAILHRRISSPVRRNVISRGLYRAGCIAAYIAVSESARKSLVGSGIPSERTNVVPSGVDVHQLCPSVDRRELRAQLGLEQGTWIGTVASLSRKKGVDTFLRAAALMAKARPDWRYLVVGGGPEHDALRELAQQLGIASRVRFTGFVDNACDYTSVLDAFAFASLREGSPGVVKEAMALRVPVVAADAPGTNEVMTSTTGKLVRQQDPDALAAALCGLFASPDTTRVMVNRAYAHVAANYSMQQTIDATIAVYQKVRQQSLVACATLPTASHSEGTR